MPTIMPTLIGLDREQLGQELQRVGVPNSQLAIRVAQLWKGCYVRGFRDFSLMPSLGQSLQRTLTENFSLARPEIAQEQISVDGTRKWLLRFAGRTSNTPSVEVESVYIPEPDRGTLCVSSQVGCSLECTFCYTGTQKMVRNLTAAEILGQILIARDQLTDYPDRASNPEIIKPAVGRAITNIVMMGMGEPLFNFENVITALKIALDKEGMGFSRRRITLSTSGVVPRIRQTGSELNIMLAISLHAVNDELRNELVPINRKYPISQLLQACREYPGLSNSRRITFEYVMLRGVNDSIADARELVRLLANIPAKINLIPFNPWPGSKYECSSAEVIQRFAGYLHKQGYLSPIRTPRGQDILAACGQLKSETLKTRVNLTSSI